MTTNAWKTGFWITANKTKHLSLFFLLAAFVALASCVGAPSPYHLDSGQMDKCPAEFDESDHVMAVLWCQYAAEARALYYQAYNIAGDRLDAAIAHSDPKDNLAIIMDIDETILDNSPFEAFLIQNGSPFTPELWSEWTAQCESQALPGAQPFLAYAASHGVAVFYLSNRSSDEFEATVRNLNALQFPMVDSSHLLLQMDGSGKEPNRLKVGEKYKVVLLMGDNLGDFSAVFDRQGFTNRFELADANRAEFGRRFIVLPNPMYGDWENSLYPSHGLDENMKIKLRRELLKSWQRPAGN